MAIKYHFPFKGGSVFILHQNIAKLFHIKILSLLHNFSPATRHIQKHLPLYTYVYPKDNNSFIYINYDILKRAQKYNLYVKIVFVMLTVMVKIIRQTIESVKKFTITVLL